VAEDKVCALADAAVMEVTPPWPRCSGPVSAVRVFYREGGDRAASLWNALATVRDQSPSGDLWLCAAHIERLKRDGLRVS
jgi:hypothetical protein